MLNKPVEPSLSFLERLQMLPLMLVHFSAKQLVEEKTILSKILSMALEDFCLMEWWDYQSEKHSAKKHSNLSVPNHTIA